MVRTTTTVTVLLCCLVLLLSLSGSPAVAADQSGSPPTDAERGSSAPLPAGAPVTGGTRASEPVGGSPLVQPDDGAAAERIRALRSGADGSSVHAADNLLRSRLGQVGVTVRVARRNADATEIAGTSAGPRPRLSPELVTLRDETRRILRSHFSQNLNTRDHSPWAVMHATIAFGVDTQVRVGGPHGTPVTAIGWLCFNREAGGQHLFYPSGDRFGISKGPGVQGHSGQLLAILAQSNVMPDYTIQVGNTDLTVMDLVEYEKQTCAAQTELTFKLIGLSHYLDLDAAWQNESGQQWSIPRLLREELAQPIQGATCGGSHRLMGLSYAVRKRAVRGEPITGEYRRALVFVRDYHEYTFRLQNPDGSFSTAWFRRREDRPDPARKLETTGHILEWLAFSLPQADLEDPRMIRAVHYVNSLLSPDRNNDWKIGSLGHALRALRLYDQRVFGGTTDDYRQPVLATMPRTAVTKADQRGR